MNGQDEIKTGSEIPENDSQETTENSENQEGVETPEVDVVALSELISDKDKELKQLKAEVDKLKKANAQMVVQLTADQYETEDIGKTIIDFCDTRK